MIFALDHVVLSASAPEREEVSARLEGCGFVAEPFSLSFPEIGASSESWSFASGGFLEFVSEREPGTSGLPWFTETPRVIGLGFASDDFERDTGWAPGDGAWEMDESHTLNDGTALRIHAAGPHEHFSDFFVFVMDRPVAQLQFALRRGAPKLSRVVLAGGDAASWRGSLARWLKLPDHADDLRIGDVPIAFREDDGSSVRVSLEFAADLSERVQIPLGAGQLEIGTPSTRPNGQ